MSRFSKSVVLGLAVTGLAAVSLNAERKIDVKERAKGAEHVVVAAVQSVQPRFDRNEYGDQLIVSRVKLRVTETLKGAPPGQLDLDVEGGSIGDLTLTVSDLPKLEVGERAVFFLEQASPGLFKPHLRGLGILKLDTGDRVPAEDLSLSDVRALVQSGGR